MPVQDSASNHLNQRGVQTESYSRLRSAANEDTDNFSANIFSKSMSGIQKNVTEPAPVAKQSMGTLLAFNPATGGSLVNDQIHGGSGVLVASRITPGQERDLKFLLDMAVDPKPSATNIKIAKDFLSKWKPPKADLVDLRNKAETVVKDLFDRSGSKVAEHAKNWSGYNNTQRAAVVQEFVRSMNATMGTNFNVNFVDSPPENNRGGWYTAENNMITVNINKETAFSLGEVYRVAFHEAVHGNYINATRGMDINDVMRNVKNGSISLTAGTAYANASFNLFTSPEENYARYLENPHEELAFSGDFFLTRALTRRGINIKPFLPNSHSTIRNINKHGL